jgi:hypothetical protein
VISSRQSLTYKQQIALRQRKRRKPANKSGSANVKSAVASGAKDVTRIRIFLTVQVLTLMIRQSATRRIQVSAVTAVTEAIEMVAGEIATAIVIGAAIVTATAANVI